MADTLTPKQRMLNAYRGRPNDRVAIAPEFWYYYPARLLGVDMIEFARDVPFHQALKTTFETFGCDGWGIAAGTIPNADVTGSAREYWLDNDTLEIRTTTRTPHGELTAARQLSRTEPSWVVERPVKEIERDLPAYEFSTIGADPSDLRVDAAVKAYNEVGESYLLEFWLGVPFFDYYGGGRAGGFEQAIFDIVDAPERFVPLQQRYLDFMVRKAAAVCETTPFESLVIGCSWSCNSLIGPEMWRHWDKPVIKAVCDEVHRHGRLLHVHFHGKCMETVGDFAEVGIDCVCPFERPPGGDVAGFDGLQEVASLLGNRTTMNGNVHTVEALIRGTPGDVRREVREILEAFRGNPRVIVGTGDQVGRETPEENLLAMIEEAKTGTRNKGTVVF